VRSARVHRVGRGLLIGCLAFGVGAAATAAAPGTSAKPSTNSSFRPQAPVSAIPAAESSAFGVLREAQAPGDAFGPAALTPAGANPDLARSVAVATSALSTGRVWVVPADDAVCLRVLDPSAGDGWVCASAADAAAGRLIGAMRRSPGDDGPAFVHGLVPDGVTDVTITGPAGQQTSVPVTDNVYGTTVAATPATVAFGLADGQSVTLAVP
jgi:hypothetical protein